MQKNTSPGKFIVFEGIDGAGKTTQARLLYERLKKEGYKVASIHFPQYKTKSGGMIEKYLGGNYGKIDSYKASIFYAADRFDGGYRIREWLKKGYIVVADRYMASNIGHQGGKIRNRKDREKYFRWLYNLEYRLFEIPKPDTSFLLRMPPAVAQKLRAKLAKQQGKKLDIHEKDLSHLKHADEAYAHAASLFPQLFKIISCMNFPHLLTRQKIHTRIWNEVKELL